MMSNKPDAANRAESGVLDLDFGFGVLVLVIKILGGRRPVADPGRWL